MWSSANGSGMRSQRTPARPRAPRPGGGGVVRNCRAERARMRERRASMAVWYRGHRAPPRCRQATLQIAAIRMSSTSRTPPPELRAATYTISDLAREFALTTRAIRFYEDCGLLAPRTRGRARVYGERERVRLKLILRGKRLGLALSEIGELLDLYEVRAQRARAADGVPGAARRAARAPAAAARGHRDRAGRDRRRSSATAGAG